MFILGITPTRVVLVNAYGTACAWLLFSSEITKNNTFKNEEKWKTHEFKCIKIQHDIFICKDVVESTKGKTMKTSNVRKQFNNRKMYLKNKRMLF